MDIINILIGILLNIVGAFLIKYYLLLVKEKKHGGLTINLMGAGIGAIIIGIVLIVKELNK